MIFAVSAIRGVRRSAVTPDGLRVEDALAGEPGGRGDGDHQDDDAHPTEPLADAAPQEDRVRLALDLVEQRGAVVVKPLMLSKNASTGASSVPSRTNGTAPTAAAATQAIVTAKNPSRARRGIDRNRRADATPSAASGVTTSAGTPNSMTPPSPPATATTKQVARPSPTARSVPEMTGTMTCQLRLGPN
jgi:hypothetical protein